ncbi:PEP-CTERM sorting domain-containing protein [Verrucomicrobiaceae bacterium 5K15]|uniref:PEP-CTERM sorting domain-containing protein n=1 Tax=Oceaniferula flava TaxID=2800421 RepID=A0AAE2SDG5_9BACT|nr:PEP-CTERM sorting domain-containing protein [Oceaniferula flavus]MBK1854972.1 PEP-CTERM sorting domain-containing protein [Oceaniferula flavus]MBM1136278.1 PEP-CTERM sorting domain-containing protein [Oceaniferula flavus]
MKLNIFLFLAAASLSANAATVDTTLGSYAGGNSNTWQTTMGVGDDTSFSSQVSTWGWEALDLNSSGGTGWRHTSQWLELTLTEDAIVTINISNDPTETIAVGTQELFPSFTIYSGFNNENATQAHTYNNRADTTLSGAADPLIYLNHVANSTEDSINVSYSLAAGDYTFAIGGFAEEVEGVDSVNRTYFASVTTTAVPEPSSLLLLGLSSLGLLRRRR